MTQSVQRIMHTVQLQRKLCTTNVARSRMPRVSRCSQHKFHGKVFHRGGNTWDTRGMGGTAMMQPVTGNSSSMLYQQQQCAENRNSVQSQFLKTVLKCGIRSDSFLIKAACTFKEKVTNSNFTCIKCADKKRFKTRPKQSLAYKFQNSVIVFTCCHCCEVKIMSSTVAVLFAVN